MLDLFRLIQECCCGVTELMEEWKFSSEMINGSSLLCSWDWPVMITDESILPRKVDSLKISYFCSPFSPTLIFQGTSCMKVPNAIFPPNNKAWRQTHSTLVIIVLLTNELATFRSWAVHIHIQSTAIATNNLKNCASNATWFLTTRWHCNCIFTKLRRLA